MTGVILLVHLVMILSFSFLLWKKNWRSWHIYWPALIIKLMAGVCLGLLYIYHFPVGDTFLYFRDGARLSALATQDFGSYMRLIFFNEGTEAFGLELQEPRALFLSKVTSFFNLLTLNNYWAIALYYSFISFLCSWFLVTVIHDHLRPYALPAVVAFLFMPSVVFWTSGLLKESLAVGAFFFLIGLFLRLWHERTIPLWQWITGCFALWVLWNLKYYYAGVFVAVIATNVIFKRWVGALGALSPRMRTVIWLLILLVPIATVSFLHPNFNADRVLEVIVSNNAAYNKLSQPGEYVQFYALKAEPVSFLLNAPWALFSGLFRPVLWETTSMAQLAQGLENSVLLIISFAAAFRSKKDNERPLGVLGISTIVFIVITAVFITMSAPNFGTLSRYRVGYLSVFTFLVLCGNPVLLYLQRRYRGLTVMNGKS